MTPPPPPSRPARRAPRLLPLGRFRGVPLYLSPSWLLIAAFLTGYYGPVVEDAVGSVSASSAYLVAFAYAALFAGCVLLHELGHTAASLALGRPVKRVVIFLLGGVSELVREPEGPREEFLVSAAGPAVSAVLVGLLGIGVATLPAHTMLGVLVALLFWSNVIVVVFNLLPGLPLDGGRLLRATVWALGRSPLTGTRAATVTGRIVAVLVAVSGLVVEHSPLGFGAALLSFVLAGYMWVAAGQALRIAEVLARVPEVHLDRLLRRGLLVPDDISVAEALRRARGGDARGLVLVDAHEQPAAIADEARVASVPLDHQPWTQLRAVARPLERGLVLPLGLAGSELLEAIRTTPASEYLVVNTDGSPAGILATADLADVLRPAGP